MGGACSWSRGSRRGGWHLKVKGMRGLPRAICGSHLVLFSYLRDSPYRTYLMYFEFCKISRSMVSWTEFGEIMKGASVFLDGPGPGPP